MRTLVIALAALLLPILAHADQGSLLTYTSYDWQFAVDLPGGGVISDAYSDPDWDKQDANTVFTWVALRDKDPVFLVMASAMKLDADATDQDVSDFMTGMTDADNAKKNNIEVEKVNDVFKVGNRGWTSARYKYTDNTPGEFESFVTREGPYIYAISCHFTQGASGGDDIAQAVLASFTVPSGQ